MKIVEFYNQAKKDIILKGYQNEIDWVESRQFKDQNVTTFFGEYMYVVINSGMKNQIADSIYRRAIKAGMSAVGHPQKRKALELGMKMKEQWFKELKEKKTLNERLEYLETLPFIGPITKYHLARNLGIDCAKPDRHLTRIAERFGYSDVQKMCKELSDATGDRIGTVDIVLWRYSNLNSNKKREKESEKHCKDCNDFNTRLNWCNTHSRATYPYYKACNDIDEIIRPKIYSRYNDSTLVKCNQCDWEGKVMDMVHDYRNDGCGGVEAVDECPMWY